MIRRTLLGIFATVAFVFLCADAYSQSAKLKGKITDETTKEAIPIVNISVKSTDGKVSTGTSSDFDGNYEIKLSSGTYKIEYTCLGYRTHNEKVNISGTDVTKNVVLTQDAQIIEEVVVSAGKYEQKLQDITISMEVLKPQAIENKNTFNIESSLNKVPGVDVNNHQPSIRSCTGWSYGAGSRVMILVDEMPIMSADVGDAKWNYIIPYNKSTPGLP